MRHTGWMRWRGDKTGLGQYDGDARKLLGSLEQRLKLGGITTGALRRTLADGAVLDVAVFNGQPVVRVSPPVAPGSELPEPSPQAVQLQGFTVRPDGAGAADLDELLLVPGSPNDEGERPWLSLFYDAAHTPDPAPDGPRGNYGANPLGKPVFPDGIGISGNLDWRNADESLVVTFFGPEDRYFQQVVARNIPARGTSLPNFNTPFSTLVMINGEVVLDHADHPTYNQGNEVVLGACIRDGHLVWCVTGIAFGDPFLRFYMAPLARHADAGWATGPVRLGPRFARIAAADMQLLHEYYWPGSGDFFDHQLFVFNQSATEGRILFWSGADTIELVFDFRDLENPFVTTEEVDDRTVAVVVSSPSRTQTVVANAFVTGSRDIDDEISYFWGFGVRPYRLKGYSYNIEVELANPTGVCAVDYKDDVPVYAHTIRILAGNQITQQLQFSAAPTVSPVVPAVPGHGFSTTNSTSGTREAYGNNRGLILPWGKTIEAPTSFTYSGTGSASASFRYGTSAGAPEEATLNGQSTAQSQSINHYMVPFYCDLRNDTIVYGLVVSTQTVDLSWSSQATGVYPNIKASITNTATERTVRTMQLFVHVNGEDVAVSDPETIYDETVVTNTPSAPTIGAASDAIRYAHDTGLLRGDQLDSPAPRTLIFAAQALDNEAYSRASGTANTAMMTALRDMVGVSDGFAVADPMDVSGELDAAPSVPTTPATAALTAEPLWVTQRGFGEDTPLPMVGASWLYGPQTSPPAAMPWGMQTIPYRSPKADPETYYEFERWSYGTWQSLRDAYAFSMPWPIGAAERFRSELAGGDFTERAGYAQGSANYPIAITSRFLYGFR